MISFILLLSWLVLELLQANKQIKKMKVNDRHMVEVLII